MTYRVLDVCCSGRKFWFDKRNPQAVYCDQRREDHVLVDGRTYTIHPMVQADFKSLPFPNDHFDLVVYDPPHRSDLGLASWMAIQYGVLLPDWRTALRAGFDQCMRVLRPSGTLIFKWSEGQFKLREVLDSIGQEPLFGHKTSNTAVWTTFLKSTVQESA